MLDTLAEGLGAFVRTLAAFGGLVVAIGVLAHALTWLLFRRRATRFVWSYWNALGVLLIVTGFAGLGYGWLALGLQSTAGSALAGLGLLLLSAGLWMIIPV